MLFTNLVQTNLRTKFIGQQIEYYTRLKSVANSEENLMPAIIEAVRYKCTLGEISDALRECFGEFNQS